MNSKNNLPTAVVAAVLGVALLASAPARAAGVHERGTVTSVDGGTVMVKSREGKDLSFNIDDGWNVVGAAKATMADIKTGTFIGTATTGADDGMKALEVVVFPEKMRGVGEGHYDWDLKPKTMMTNATVNNAVKDVDGQTVTLTYKGGEKKVAISDTTPIVQLTDATKADVKPGAAVFIAAPGEADGKLQKGTVVVGLDGATPPM